MKSRLVDNQTRRLTIREIIHTKKIIKTKVVSLNHELQVTATPNLLVIKKDIMNNEIKLIIIRSQQLSLINKVTIEEIKVA